MKKKIIWIIVLIVFVAGIAAVVYFVNANKGNSGASNTIDNTFNKDTNAVDETNTVSEANGEYIKKELDDGVLYSFEGKEYEADFVVGDNYYDTTITDMYLSPADYMDKIIEIEGMYLDNPPYTFVGRYSTSNLCAYCPQGYSYLEYQLYGTIDREFTPEEDWIKLVGKLEKGNDATSNYQDYYFLRVLSLELMNESGQATVNN